MISRKRSDVKVSLPKFSFDKSKTIYLERNSFICHSQNVKQLIKRRLTLSFFLKIKPKENVVIHLNTSQWSMFTNNNSFGLLRKEIVFYEVFSLYLSIRKIFIGSKDKQLITTRKKTQLSSSACQRVIVSPWALSIESQCATWVLPFAPWPKKRSKLFVRFLRQRESENGIEPNEIQPMFFSVFPTARLLITVMTSVIWSSRFSWIFNGYRSAKIGWCWAERVTVRFETISWPVEFNKVIWA